MGESRLEGGNGGWRCVVDGNRGLHCGIGDWQFGDIDFLSGMGF